MAITFHREPVRNSTEPRYHVRHITSMDSRVPLYESERPYSWADMVLDDMISLNDVLRLIKAVSDQYGVDRPAVRSGFGPRKESGSVTRFRWAWERECSWGGRMSDMIIVHEITDRD